MSDEEQIANRQWRENPSEELARAFEQMQAGDYAQAVEYGKRAIALWPTYYDAWLLLAGAYDEMGDLDAALEAAQRASEIAAHELSQGWNTLAALHLIRGEYEEALMVDRILDVIDPSRHAITTYRMAVAHTALGDIDNGERWLREAIYHREDLLDRAAAEPLLEVHYDWLETIRLEKDNSE